MSLFDFGEAAPSKAYDLGYGHLGNGITVWNRLEEEHGDYKTVAHIAPDRTVTFYDEKMPQAVREEIQRIANTSEMTISATQDAPVFSTPPMVQEPPQREEGAEGSYQLLSRLKADCDYFLGAGGRAEKHLWAGSVDAQIAKMRELYNALPEKPEWLTSEDIDRYESQMTAPVREKKAPAQKEELPAPPSMRGAKFSPSVLHPETPNSERHNFRITDDHLGEGGAKTKFRNNVAAIQTLKQVEAEGRLATPEEQEILSRYVGWGGLPQAFDGNNPQWADEFAELQKLLSPEEYEAAKATTLNAHYTSPTVIKAIYQAVENMGFRTGNILEPSCGIGNFFGLVP